MVNVYRDYLESWGQWKRQHNKESSMVGDNQGESPVPSCFPACTWGHACQHSVACHSDCSMLVTVSWFCHVAQKTSAELSWHGNVSTANFFVASHLWQVMWLMLNLRFFFFLSFFLFHFFFFFFFSTLPESVSFLFPACSLTVPHRWFTQPRTWWMLLCWPSRRVTLLPQRLVPVLLVGSLLRLCHWLSRLVLLALARS